ncbi:MAG TPA: hypothetical protein VEL07_09925 [Planctomycetota bacterium]|nr:hypothetical protein [Planctomycetota bacterium]
MSGVDLARHDVIRDFRAQLARFLHAGATALGGAGGELHRVRDWLWSVQRPYWRNQLRHRHEAYVVARRAWLDAEVEVRQAAGGRGARRQDATEERFAMERARRARDQAEERVATVRAWLARLERDGAPLAHACQGHDLALARAGAQALAQLERLAAHVDAYLALPASAADVARAAPGDDPDDAPVDGRGGPACAS